MRLYEDLNADRLLLPSLPHVAVRIGEAVNEENSDARRVASLIETDPAIAVKIVKAANSARFGGASRAATVAEAVARQNQANEDFERASGLFESGSASKREYDQALASRDAASARVTAARSAVETAEQQVEYTLVRAPYAGIVTERHVQVGETVGVGQPLISGLSLENLRVVVDLPQQVAADVRKHLTAYIVTGQGRVRAENVTIFPYAHPASNTFRVRLDLPAGQFDLYPGMFVKVAFVVGESQRLLIPASSLIRRSEVTGVYVVDDQDRVRLRQVRVGGTYDDRTEILAGLRPGERIATDPVAAGIYLKARSAKNDD